MSAPTHSSGFFQISSSIDNVAAIFVYLQRAKTNNAEANPYEFDTFNINADRDVMPLGIWKWSFLSRNGV